MARKTAPIYTTPDYGLRKDGTPKGKGYFGELKRTDGKVSTELSIGVSFDGKPEQEVPLIVPTLDQTDIDHLLAGGEPTPAQVQKAMEHAKQRLAAGRSPFAREDEAPLPIPPTPSGPLNQEDPLAPLAPSPEAAPPRLRDHLIKEEQKKFIDMNAIRARVGRERGASTINMRDIRQKVATEKANLFEQGAKPGAPIPEEIRRAFREKTGSDAPAVYPEDSSVLELLKDFGKDIAYWGIAATAVGGGLAVAGVTAPVWATALGAGALYAGLKGADAAFSDKPQEDSTLSEMVTGQQVPGVARPLLDTMEAATLMKGGPEFLKLSKVWAKKAKQPLDYVTKKASPVGEWVWDNVVVPPTTWQLPVAKKSVGEMLQPGVERLAKSLNPKLRQTAATVRRAEVQKALATSVGRKASEVMEKLLPSERYEFLKGLRGTSLNQLSSQKVKDSIDGLNGLMQEARLDVKYENKFREELSKALTKPVEAVEGAYDPKDLMTFLTDMEKQLPAKVKRQHMEKMMQEVIDNPSTSDEISVFMKDLWSSSARTPMAVADAARLASTHYITQKLVNNKGVLSKVAKPGYIKSEWGKFAGEGLYLPRDLEFQLRDMSKLPQIARGVYQKWFLSPWKMSKTILRPAYHARNLMSNVILNDWGGLPFYRVDVYGKALRGMRGKSNEWKEFIRKTGLSGQFTQNDLYELGAGTEYGANMFDKAYAVFDKVTKPARTLQNAEESWFKFAKYLHNKELGMDTTEAALDSQKWLMNFGEVTSELAYIRKYGIPFATWYSKSLPLLAETAVKHPLRLLKWIEFGRLIQSFSLEQNSLSAEEWEGIEKDMPEYMSRGVYLLAPWRDSQNRLNLINLTYIIPGIGDLNEAINVFSPSKEGGQGLTLPNPLITTLGALSSKEKFSGAPLYYDWEDPSTKFAKGFGYVWDQMAPAMAPGGTDWDMLWKSLTEQEGAPSPEAALGSLFGIKATPIDEMKNAQVKTALKKIHSSEIQRQMIKELQRAKSSEETNKVLEKYEKYRMEVMQR